MSINPIMTMIQAVFEPAAKLVDALHTSEEERIDAKTRMLVAQTDVTMKILDYEAQLMQMKSSVIMAEANGESWLQRTWRPITMLTFLFLIVGHHLGLLDMPLSDNMWDILKIGVGGYITSRGVEKTMASYKSAPK